MPTVDRITRTLRANPTLEQAAARAQETLAAGAQVAREKATAAALLAVEKRTARIDPAALQRLLTDAFTGIDPATRAQMADRLRAAGHTPPPGMDQGAGGIDALGLAGLAMAAMKGFRGGPGGMIGVLLLLAGSRAGSAALARRAMASPTGARFGAAEIAEIARSPLARQALTAMQQALLRRR